MTVRIPISADAAAVTRAFADIQNAIRRAGQEARAFRDLDLSHPELAGVATDLRQIQQNMDDLGRIGRGSTAAAWRRINPADPFEAMAQAGRAFPNHGDRNRFVGQAGSYLLGGTRFAPPPPGAVGVPGYSMPTPAGPAPTSGGAAGASGGGIFGGLANAIRGGVGFVLGAAGIQGVANTVTRAVSQAQGEAVSNDTLLRTLRDATMDFDRLRRSVRDASAGLGLTYEETQRLSMAFAKEASETDAGRANAGMRTAAGFARGMGMDPGSAAGAMGRMAFLGEDPRRFAALVAETARASGMTGRSEEVMQALVRWTETSARQMATPGTQDNFAAAYAALSGSGVAGMRGGGAEALLSDVNQSIRGGGGAGDASQHIIYRAMARRGITDPYQIQYMTEGGMFEQVGRGGPTAFRAIMDEINSLYGGSGQSGQGQYRRLHAIGRMFGIDSRRASMLDSLGDGQLNGIGDALSGAGVRLQDIDPSGLRDMAEVSRPGADLAKWRATMLARPGLSDERRRDLEGAQGDAGLRSAIIRSLAETGGGRTDGSDVRQSQADTSNALTRIGTGMIPAMNDLRDGLAAVGDKLGVLSEVLGDAYSAMTGDAAAAARLRARAGVSGGAEGASGRALPPGEQAAAAQEGYGILTGLGWQPHQAAGLVANVHHESGFNPRAIGDGGRARGILQWHPDRQAAFNAWARDNAGGRTIADATTADQWRFMDWELTQGAEQAAGRALRATTDAAQAGAVASRAYVRPGVSEQARNMEAASRAATARRIAPGLAGGGVLFGPPAPATLTPMIGLPGEAEMPGNGSAPAAAPSREQLGFNIAPLRVIHETQDGQMIGEDILPVTRFGQAMPWGLA